MVVCITECVSSQRSKGTGGATVPLGARVELSDHAKDRMKERGISEEQVLEAIRKPTRVLRDTKRNRLVYIKSYGRLALFVIVEGTRVVTVWIADRWERVVERKVRKGEWSEGDL